MNAFLGRAALRSRFSQDGQLTSEDFATTRTVLEARRSKARSVAPCAYHRASHLGHVKIGKPVVILIVASKTCQPKS